MDYEHDRMRMNVEGDRLSSLPDELIHKILSFIDFKQVVETSVLSSRWRLIWTSMPYLNFLSKDFYLGFPDEYYRPRRDLSKFVNRVLSGRNNQIQVFSIKLDCEWCNVELAKKILAYAFSYSVQHLTITNLITMKHEFPLSLFSSESLKHLTLSGSSNIRLCMPASSWELLALTTLHLTHVRLYDDENTDKGIGLFSKCTNLKNLTLDHCEVTGLDGFHITHPQLSNLTLENGGESLKVVNVVAPKLVNLTIKDCRGEHLISTPELSSLLFKGVRFSLQFSPDGFPLLEEVHLCIYHEDARNVLGLLQQLNSVKFLTLNLELVQSLSSSVELISHQPSPFANLKSLRIYPECFFRDGNDTVSTEVLNYFLSSSPNVAFTLILREEVRAAWNITRAMDLMADLRVMLEKKKANIETNRDCLDQGIPAEVENQTQLNIHERTRQIENCWEYLSGQIEQGKAMTDDIIFRLQYIEQLLTELPASKRAKIQPSFSPLSSEANTVLTKIMESMKIQCDAKQSHLNVYFQQFTSTSQAPSS